MLNKLNHYREIIERIVRQHAQYPVNQQGIQKSVICDRISDDYLLMSFGWNGNQRTNSLILQVRILDGKFWVEWDFTEYGIEQELLDAGVPREDIVPSMTRRRGH